MKNTIMLKKNYEFKNVLTKGKYFSGKYIEAFLLKNNRKKRRRRKRKKRRKRK